MREVGGGGGGGGGGHDPADQEIIPNDSNPQGSTNSPVGRFPGRTRKTWKDFRDEHRKLSEEFTAKNHHYWICFHRD